MKDEDRYLNLKEACELLGLTKFAIYNRRHRESMPYTKVGRLLRFRKSDLDKWLEKTTHHGFSSGKEAMPKRQPKGSCRGDS